MANDQLPSIARPRLSRHDVARIDCPAAVLDILDSLLTQHDGEGVGDPRADRGPHLYRAGDPPQQALQGPSRQVRTTALTGYSYLVKALDSYMAEIDPGHALNTITRRKVALKLLREDLYQLALTPIWTLELPDE